MCTHYGVLVLNLGKRAFLGDHAGYLMGDSAESQKLTVVVLRKNLVT